jgi:hypothetical protein
MKQLNVPQNLKLQLPWWMFSGFLIDRKTQSGSQIQVYMQIK